MPWDDGLVGPALEIARSEANSLRVMAGPGTGKSFCMQRRVAKLLEHDNVDPQRILAVTFTRNAANSLVEDLRNIGAEGCDQVRASTLHSFCFGLLSNAAVFQHTDRVPRPLINITKSKVLHFEGAPLLADIMNQGPFGAKRDCTERLRAFEAAWARLQSERPGWPTNAVDQQFHVVLINWLKFHEAMVIGELVPEALKFVRANPAHPAVNQFDHVIVDEYQDLNRAEQVLIDRLCRNGCIAIVGDEDQSIYSFRNAHPEGIAEFDDYHPGTEDYSLLECRRCPTQVVELADHLIRQNHEPGNGVRLTPMDGNQEGQIHIVQWPSVEDERDGLTQYVDYLIREQNYEPGEIIVLTPSRLLGYGIRTALQALEIPAHSFYHEEPLEPEQSQKSFALLTLLVNPEDRVTLRWWLGFGSGTWRRREYARLRTYCEENSTPPREVLENVVAGRLELAGITALIGPYEALQREIAELTGLPCLDLLNQLYPADEEWAAPMHEVGQLVVEKIDDDNVPGLLDGLRTSVTQPEVPEGEFVRVMSLHKSKGLTSEVVLVTDCIQGLIPRLADNLGQAARERELQEQRRLFYVAITRCTERLVMSSVTQLSTALAYRIGARLRGPRRRTVRPTITTRFISEMGPSAPDAVDGASWIEHEFQ